MRVEPDWAWPPVAPWLEPIAAVEPFVSPGPVDEAVEPAEPLAVDWAMAPPASDKAATMAIERLDLSIKILPNLSSGAAINRRLGIGVHDNLSICLFVNKGEPRNRS